MSTLETIALKLELIAMKLDNLQGLGVKVDNLQMLMGANAASTTEALSKVIHNEMLSHTPAVKEKKKVATVDGAASTVEEKKVAVAKTHPSLPNVTEAAWVVKGKGDEYDKHLDWFIAVLSKHKEHIHPLIGTDEIKRIEASETYSTLLCDQKKQGDREKAKSFLKALKIVRTKENTFAELSKKLVADYDTQLGVLNSQKIGQLTAEPQSASEAAAASALTTALGAQVNVHTTTSADVTTTTSPAAQLAVA